MGLDLNGLANDTSKKGLCCVLIATLPHVLHREGGLLALEALPPLDGLPLVVVALVVALLVQLLPAAAFALVRLVDHHA